MGIIILENQLSEILPQICDFFGIGELRHRRDGGGYANTNLIVETSKGSYFIRFSQEHSLEQIESELLVIKHVFIHGIPVPTPITAIDGESTFKVQNGLVSVFKFVEGESSETVSPSGIIEIARTLGKLHCVEYDHLPHRETWWTPTYLEDNLPRAKTLFEYENVKKLSDRIASLPKMDLKKLPRGIVHGDPWPNNALFYDDEFVALVDWEETTVGYPIYDLVYLAIHGCFPEDRFDPELFQSVLQAYEVVRKLNTYERKCMVPIAQRIACTNSLWLLLKQQGAEIDFEPMDYSDWYWGLGLENLGSEC